mmetsp:Transcript_31139/g.81622  ORF Transcript_31139/g.81622 Transcript_31139/m.81622 type:complete len:234 (+) Transcript_31139:402-1103(+)
MGRVRGAPLYCAECAVRIVGLGCLRGGTSNQFAGAHGLWILVHSRRVGRHTASGPILGGADGTTEKVAILHVRVWPLGSFGLLHFVSCHTACSGVHTGREPRADLTAPKGPRLPLGWLVHRRSGSTRAGSHVSRRPHSAAASKPPHRDLGAWRVARAGLAVRSICGDASGIQYRTGHHSSSHHCRHFLGDKHCDAAGHCSHPGGRVRCADSDAERTERDGAADPKVPPRNGNV